VLVAVHEGKIVGFGVLPPAMSWTERDNISVRSDRRTYSHRKHDADAPAFARAVVPHGTTTVIADPHEIVNVMGLNGLEYMLENSRDLPINIYFMLPSCVPATHLETSGAVIRRRICSPGSAIRACWNRRNDEFPV
jgi:adenine deaminase